MRAASALVVAAGLSIACPSRALAKPAPRECAAAAQSAQELRGEARLIEAREKLIFCANEECPAGIARDCAQWESEVAASVPTLVFGAQGEEGSDVIAARVLVDGAPVTDKLDGSAVPIDPGPHTFRFERAGHPPIERKIVVRQGEKNRLLLVDWRRAEPPRSTPADADRAPAPLAPSPRPSPPALAYLLGGIAVVALGVGAYLGARATSDFDDLKTSCGVGGTCSPSAVSGVRAKYWAADISLGVSVVSLGAALWLFLRPAARPAATPPIGRF